MDAPTVNLGKHPVTLARPSTFAALSLARTSDQIATLPHPAIFALQATALATCWPAGKTWPGKVPPTPWKASMDVDTYGAAIFDDLIAADLSISEVMRAGTTAYRWAMSTLPADREVKQAEDFPEAPTGG